jgi:hypothetical protein
MTSRSITPHALKTLFLQAPSFDGFDGGAGSRYQAKREVKSFWYPTWLDLGNREADADKPGHDEMASARRRQVLPLPAHARGVKKRLT